MFHELVRVVEFSPIDMGDHEESIRFRIEIFGELPLGEKFSARVLRLETYRLTPSFSRASAAGPFDHEMLVVDDHIGQDRYESTSAAQTLRLVENRLREVFPDSFASPSQ